MIKPSALGDVAHALQVVPYLKESGCCDQLGWVVDEVYVPLLQCCPQIDEIIPYPRTRWRRNWPVREMLSWAQALRSMQYDVTLDLQGLARSGVMTLAAGSRRRIGLQSAREGSRLCYNELVLDQARHAVDRYALACGSLSQSCPVPGNYLKVDKPEDLPAKLKTGEYLILHPYSQRIEKCWPWRNYSELVSKLPRETFVLVGTGEWFPCSGENVIDYRNQTDLNGLLQLIRGSKGMIGTDSGPLHIAAAFNKPVVGIYGASLPERTRPRGKQATYLWDDSFQHENASALHGPVVSAKAMSAISADRVAAAWRNLVTA
ncbi:MAG: glycosyltransferase family 9 protein [Verrucomicrobiota bacterium]